MIRFVKRHKVVNVMLVTCKSKEVGKPTMLLLPITTAFFPVISTLDLSSSSMHPLGVQGINKGSLPLIARFPMFSGWNPSTSFSMLSTSTIFSSSKCCPSQFLFWSSQTPTIKTNYILQKPILSVFFAKQIFKSDKKF